jgi:hypothetical protein
MTSRANQGGFQDWAQLRNHLIDSYGTTPHPTTEAEIIEAYELHPDQVTKAGLDLIHATGITSKWGVLKSRAARISTPPSNPTRPASQDREKRINRAEQWIRTTGCHYDRDTEIVDELFGDRGLLEQYAQDTGLVTIMTTLWQERRPIGEQIEQDAITAANKWKTWKQAEAKALAPSDT